MAIPTAMPVISRNVPAWTNDDFSGAFPAAHADNSTYGGSDYWRCAQTPVGGADSGTLIAPVYLAYDLSGVPVEQRQQVVLCWYNDPSTDPYDSTIEATNYNNSPAAYTVDSNTAAGGGAAPVDGWTNLVTVSGETRHSRQHLVDLAGANWVRIDVTGINGSVSNNNVAINMDIHDVHAANIDNFIFFGDSITQRGFDHDDFWIPGTLPAQINAKIPTNFPLMEDGGLGGFKASDVVAGNYLAAWLPLFTGKYCGLNYGTNDANAGGAPVADFQSNMQSLVDQVVAAGKTPIVQKTIPWGFAAGIAANGPTVNAALAALFQANPNIIQGPDLWAFFGANQNLISADGIHPTDPVAGTGDGYIFYRAQWTTSLLASVYSNPPAAIMLGNHRTLTRHYR